MADESLKFNFFGLGPRSREMITDMLRIKEKYILAKLSRKWRDEVKARNYTFEKIEYKYFANCWQIRVDESSTVDHAMIVIIGDKDREPEMLFDTNSLLEPAANPLSVESQMDQVLTVTNRLMDLVTFESTEIELPPHPELDVIIARLSRFDHKVTEGTVKINCSYEALTRNHLSAVLKTFSGRELHIGQVEYGVEEDLPMNFEKVYVTGNMWMTMNMLVDNNAREIHIQYDREPGQERSHIFSDSVINTWINGGLLNLEHFSINVYLFHLIINPMGRIGWLNARLPRFTQIPRPDDAPNNGPEEGGIFIQRQDGRRAHPFLNYERGQIEFIFKPWW